MKGKISDTTEQPGLHWQTDNKLVDRLQQHYKYAGHISQQLEQSTNSNTGHSALHRRKTWQYPWPHSTRWRN